MQVFKDYWEMLAHIRHKEMLIEHKAVKVEDIKKSGKPKESKGKKGEK